MEEPGPDDGVHALVVSHELDRGKPRRKKVALNSRQRVRVAARGRCQRVHGK